MSDKPTIAELEAILEEKDVDIEILPTGEVRAIGMGFSGRPSGKKTWCENIRLLREKADRYEALLNALPDTLSADADTALWLMAHKILQHP